MAITERADQSSPLEQGDIIAGVSLFYSIPGTDSAWECEVANTELMFVLSRPCVCAHKEFVVVASVELAKIQIPSSVTESKIAIEYFTDVRDGLGQPDIFYLGKLPDRSGRFHARLDKLFTVKNADLQAQRIARLERSFQKDLHNRIFRSFSSLGFDDFGWWDTDDLKSVELYYLAEMAELNRERQELILEHDRRDLANEQISGKSTKALDTVTAKIAKLDKEVGPYISELRKRQEPIQFDAMES